MKRIIALALALVMCIALAACGKSEKEELYDKYESIIRSLEKDDYDKALEKIGKLNKKHQESTSEKENGKDKFKSLIVGEWIIGYYSNDEAVGNITFTENGECTVGGETCSWKLEKDNKTWADFVISKDGDELYKFTLNDRTENVNRLMASLWKLDGESGNEYIGDFYALSEYTVIELTAEDFFDHFEKVENVEIQKNAFDEPVGIRVGYYYVLKEEYGKAEGQISNVAIEYSYVEPRYELLNADIAGGTYELGERIEDSYGTEEYTSMTNLGEMYSEAVENRYGFSCGSLWITPETSNVYVLEIKEILRVSGNIYVLNEAE